MGFADDVDLAAAVYGSVLQPTGRPRDPAVQVPRLATSAIISPARWRGKGLARVRPRVITPTWYACVALLARREDAVGSWPQEFDDLLRSHCRFVGPGTEIDPGASLPELGMDSLEVVELIVELEDCFAFT